MKERGSGMLQSLKHALLLVKTVFFASMCDASLPRSRAALW